MKTDPKLLIAAAGYLAVVLGGFLGIIALSDAEEAGGYLVGWIGVCGSAGILVPILGRQSSTTEQLGEVATGVQALRNGELEAKIQRAVGVEAAKLAAHMERTVSAGVEQVAVERTAGEARTARSAARKAAR